MPVPASNKLKRQPTKFEKQKASKQRNKKPEHAFVMGLTKLNLYSSIRMTKVSLSALDTRERNELDP